MEAYEVFVIRFQEELKDAIKGYREKEEELSTEGAQDEAVMEKIKLNITDIFHKMFLLSLKRVNVILPDPFSQLKEAYLPFFTRIPASWKEKAQKDKEYNRVLEGIIEEIKLKRAREIEMRFIDLITKYGEEA